MLVIFFLTPRYDLALEIFVIIEINVVFSGKGAVDGGWSAWSIHTTCSVSCETGIQQRTRVCYNPRPANGGNDCRGDESQIQDCNTFPCAGGHLTH